MVLVTSASPAAAAPQTPPARVRPSEVFSPSKRRRLRKAASSHKLWVRTQWQFWEEEVPKPAAQDVWRALEIVEVTSDDSNSDADDFSALPASTPLAQGTAPETSVDDGFPCTLGEAPCTLGKAPCSLGEAPCMLGMAPCTLGEAPCTLGVAPCMLGKAPCGLGGALEVCPAALPSEAPSPGTLAFRLGDIFGVSTGFVAAATPCVDALGAQSEASGMSDSEAAALLAEMDDELFHLGSASALRAEAPVFLPGGSSAEGYPTGDASDARPHLGRLDVLYPFSALEVLKLRSRGFSDDQLRPSYWAAFHSVAVIDENYVLNHPDYDDFLEWCSGNYAANVHNFCCYKDLHFYRETLEYAEGDEDCSGSDSA